MIPCYNEARTVVQVIADFRKHLPGSAIYVFDNNSTDHTGEIALAAGACVRKVNLQGKGNVVRRMFADVEADIYVMVDGDGTYDVTAAPRLIDTLLADHLDMVVGRRVPDESSAFRAGHALGNKLLT